MDLFGIVLGRYLLEFLGAVVRYIYLNIKALISNNGYHKFSKIWSDKVNSGNSDLNHMLGVIFFGLLIVFLIFFMV